MSVEDDRRGYPLAESLSEAVHQSLMSMSAIGDPPDPEMSARWAREVAHLLDLYAREYKYGVHRFPPDISYILSGVFAEIAAGHIPDVITAATKRRNNAGRQPMWDGERQLAQVAVAYYRACRGGIIASNGVEIRINDRQPNKTIRHAYGLASRTTIANWSKDLEPISILERDASPQGLIELLEWAGAQYQHYTRGKKAE